MHRALRLAQGLLVLLALLGLFWSQAEAFSPEHWGAEGADHCCPACHAGHSPSLPTAACLFEAPSPGTHYNVILDVDQRIDAATVVARPPRAPPV